MTDLRVGGLQGWSACDWPGELVATVFCQGCAWACPYCHNPHLRTTKGDGPAWSEVVTFLRSRRGLLDGVVFSGGEPLLQSALPEAIATVRAMGFRTALHTGGPAPERLAVVLPLLDWVGFDIKAPFADYDAITGAVNSGTAAKASLMLLLQSGVPYQLRTTVHPKLLDEPALACLNADLAALECGPTLVQTFRAAGCNNPALIG